MTHNDIMGFMYLNAMYNTRYLEVQFKYLIIRVLLFVVVKCILRSTLRFLVGSVVFLGAIAVKVGNAIDKTVEGIERIF